MPKKSIEAERVYERVAERYGTAREHVLRVRVTDAERDHVEAAAAKSGRSIADYIRERIGLKRLHPGAAKGGPPPRDGTGDR